MKVLIADPLEAEAIERMRSAGFEVLERAGLQGERLIAELSGVAAMVVRGGTKVTADVLRGALDLRLVVRAGTGLDNVDLHVARERGIDVRNTPAANAVSVAELALGLLLAFERGIAPAAEALRGGRWEKNRGLGREIAGRRLGLVGFGRIGREMATRARAFEMEVWAHDPLLPAWPGGFEWVKPATLDELLPVADVLSLHVPLTPETRGLLGARELGLLEPDAILINTARGGLVDETALHAALSAGRLRGAILDVFANEPPGEHPLLALPNVLATPHLGAGTRDAQRRAGTEAAAIVIAELTPPTA